MGWAMEMYENRQPLTFNSEAWGFANERLDESSLAGVSSVAAVT